MEYEIRTTGVTVAPKGGRLFDERATTVSIDDEAGGEFVKISQCPDNAPADRSMEIRLDPEEWPLVRKAVDRMAKACRGEAP